MRYQNGMIDIHIITLCKCFLQDWHYNILQVFFVRLSWVPNNLLLLTMLYTTLKTLKNDISIKFSLGALICQWICKLHVQHECWTVGLSWDSSDCDCLWKFRTLARASKSLTLSQHGAESWIRCWSQFVYLCLWSWSEPSYFRILIIKDIWWRFCSLYNLCHSWDFEPRGNIFLPNKPVELESSVFFVSLNGSSCKSSLGLSHHLNTTAYSTSSVTFFSLTNALHLHLVFSI